jgi:hypothetical protein
MARHSLTLGRASGAGGYAPWTPWYSCLIPVLIHMFNPSSGKHLSSKSSKLHLNPHLYRATCHTVTVVSHRNATLAALSHAFGIGHSLPEPRSLTPLLVQSLSKSSKLYFSHLIFYSNLYINSIHSYLQVLK